MKIFYGRRRVDLRTIIVINDGQKVRNLRPEASQKIRNHSPGGFEWGYGGSGPAQLALAILLEVEPIVAVELYQDFKFACVGRMPYDQWELLETEIRFWMGDHTEGTNLFKRKWDGAREQNRED